MEKAKSYKALVVTIAILVLILVLDLVFIFVDNSMNEDQNSTPLIGQVVKELENKDRFSNVEKDHWGNMPVSYSITNEKECGEYETRKINKAFNEIQEKTNRTVSFIKVENASSANIELYCNFIEDCYKMETDIRGDYVIKRESICAHDKGRAQIIEREGFEIVKAKIELYGLAGFAESGNMKAQSGFAIGDCGNPDTEIHEILHVFGYEHNDNSDSIMYPSENQTSYKLYDNEQCKNADKEIDKYIITDLIGTYS